MENEKNVFVSHYNKDEENIKNLKDLLAPQGYSLKNSSIESSKSNDAKNEDYIKSILSKHIKWAGTFICLIGPHTHERPWVNWEIEKAYKLGKTIIGIYINGAKDSDIPDNLNKYGDALVGWSSKGIIDCINGDNNHWEDTTGNERSNRYSDSHGEC